MEKAANPNTTGHYGTRQEVGQGIPTMKPLD